VALTGPPGPRAALRRLLALAAPLLLTELMFVAGSTTDLVMVARLGSPAVGALALANSVIALFAIAVAPFGAFRVMVARAHGAGGDVRSVFGHGFAVAAVMAAVVIGGYLEADRIIAAVGGLFAGRVVSPALLGDAGAYCRALAWGIPLLYTQYVLTFLLAGLSRPAPDLAITALIIALNGVFDYALIFGRLGLPALGLLGSAWATNAARLVHLAILAGFVARRVDLPGEPRPFRFRRDVLAEMMTGGLRLLTMTLADAGSAFAVTAWIARLGAAPVAGHEIVRNLVVTSSAVPSALGQANTVIVARRLAEGSTGLARIAFAAALRAVASYAVIAAAVIALGAGWFPWLYTSDPAAGAIAQAALPFAALAVLASAFRSAAAAVLIALLDTRAHLRRAVACAWGVKVPLACALLLATDLGVRGAWLAQAAGEATLAVLLLARARHRLARDK